MVVAFPPNLKFLEDYAQAEAEARGAGRGIWRDSYYSVQNIDLGKLVSDGFNRISGKVTSVSRSRKNVRITVSNNLTILIYHRVWKEFWRGQDPQKLVGRQITSRGWVWSWQTEKLMRVQHPFMLQGIDH